MCQLSFQPPQPLLLQVLPVLQVFRYLRGGPWTRQNRSPSGGFGLENCCSLGMISHTRLGTCCCRPWSQVMQVRLRFEANNEASNPIFADPSQSTDGLLSTWHVPLRELPTSEVLGCRVPGSLHRGRCPCSRCFGNRVNTRSMLRKLRTDSGSP